MRKRLLGWALFVFLLMVALLVTAACLRNKLAKDYIESRLRKQTGMVAKIGLVDFGFFSPTVNFKAVKVYNPPDMGGSLFLDMPEFYLDYDRRALLSGRLHVKLLRLDINEVSIVQRKKNPQKSEPPQNKKNKSPSGGLKFEGIDTLNLSFDKFSISNAVSGRQEEIQFAMTNQESHNIKSLADVPGLGFLLVTQSLSSTNPGFDISNFVQSITGH